MNRCLGSLVLENARLCRFEFFVHHIPNSLRCTALKHGLGLVQSRQNGILVVLVNMTTHHNNTQRNTLPRHIHSQSMFVRETTWNVPPPTICQVSKCPLPFPSKTNGFPLATTKTHLRIVSGMGRRSLFSKLGILFNGLNERRSSLCFNKLP